MLGNLSKKTVFEKRKPKDFVKEYIASHKSKMLNNAS